MTISAAIVLYAITWFMVLFIVLPLRLQSQRESGAVVPGTPASAPSNPNLKKKVFWVTIIATVIWVPVCLVIVNDLISLDVFDFYNGIK